MSGIHDRRAARRASALRYTRRQLEAAIEQAIAALDALDGDADLEPECEDEGAQCEDEGSWRDGDDELSLCGVTFSTNGTDGETTGGEWRDTFG